MFKSIVWILDQILIIGSDITHIHPPLYNILELFESPRFSWDLKYLRLVQSKWIDNRFVDTHNPRHVSSFPFWWRQIGATYYNFQVDPRLQSKVIIPKSTSKYLFFVKRKWILLNWMWKMYIPCKLIISTFRRFMWKRIDSRDSLNFTWETVDFVMFWCYSNIFILSTPSTEIYSYFKLLFPSRAFWISNSLLIP